MHAYKPHLSGLEETSSKAAPTFMPSYPASAMRFRKRSAVEPIVSSNAPTAQWRWAMS